MVLVSSFGLMGLSMKACGDKTKPMDLASLLIQTVIFMKVTGKIIRLKEQAGTRENKEDFMKVDGKMMNHQESDYRIGETVIFIREVLKMGLNKVKGIISGLMDLIIKANGPVERSKATENTPIMMEELIKGNGKII